MRTCNQLGIKLIKEYEGCELIAYKDVGGLLTIGYGHVGPDVTEGLEWTQEQAESAFHRDLGKFEAQVDHLTPTTINENQFSAIVSFTYNLGASRLKQSTLLKLLFENDFEGAAKEFGKWVKAAGKVDPGLVRRRAAEQKLFETEIV